MTGTSTDAATAKRGGLLAQMTSRAGLATLAGVIVLLVSCGAYAALRGTEGGMPPSVVEPAAIPVPMPVAAKPRALRATDYSIVSVFEGEAFLATPNDLVRAVAGAVVPGLGTITSVEAFPNGGGTVVGTQAALRTQ